MQAIVAIAPCHPPLPLFLPPSAPRSPLCFFFVPPRQRRNCCCWTASSNAMSLPKDNVTIFGIGRLGLCWSSRVDTMWWVWTSSKATSKLSTTRHSVPLSQWSMSTLPKAATSRPRATLTRAFATATRTSPRRTPLLAAVARAVFHTPSLQVPRLCCQAIHRR